MAERPILFSAPMVRALLAGTKLMTRRVAKLTANGHVKEPGGHRRWHPADPNASQACPYGQPGDRLWVRETWAYQIHALASNNHEAEGPWVYAADNPQAHERLCDRWRPSIHMFRPASRITLEITGVRIERLQDISESDAEAEGAEYGLDCEGGFNLHPLGNRRHGYAHLWEEINGAGSWAANPWVWVVDFKRVWGSQ
jgi:hypothetical protein